MGSWKKKGKKEEGLVVEEMESGSVEGRTDSHNEEEAAAFSPPPSFSSSPFYY